MEAAGALVLAFTLVVPPGVTTCGVFQDGRPLALEHELKCRIRLREGRYQLRTDASTVAADLIEGLEFGPEGQAAVPLGGGMFRVKKEPSCAPGASCTTFFFEQDWQAAGQPIHLEDYLGLQVRMVNGVPDPAERTIDESSFSQGGFLHGRVGGDPADFSRTLRFSSCSYGDLPPWEVRVYFA